MDFITTEVATELGLTPEQITGLTPKYNDHLATLKQGWDGLANTNAENIITGAVKAIQTKTGITEDRQQGEKIADYIVRISDKALESKQAKVDALEVEYKQKLKDFNGNDATKAELEQAKTELDKAKQILANFDDIKAKADKFDETTEKLNGLKLEVAFTNVKPNFPDTANAYEVKAKWDEFKATVLAKYTIELIDGVPTAIDKENQYKTIKLSDLVLENKEIESLAKGRQQQGTGAKAAKNVTIEGLAFDVPEAAKTDSKERAKVIREQLAKEGVVSAHKDYAAKFSDYNKKILASK